jgi:hypothetical protein
MLNDNPAHKLQQAIDKLKFLIKHLSPNLYVQFFDFLQKKNLDKF